LRGDKTGEETNVTVGEKTPNDEDQNESGRRSEDKEEEIRFVIGASSKVR
jgi:hypothetical protein